MTTDDALPSTDTDLPSLVADYFATLRAWRKTSWPNLHDRLDALEDEIVAHPDVSAAATGGGTVRRPRDWSLLRLAAIALALTIAGAFAFAEYLRANDTETQLDICHRVCINHE